jgi:UTP-glucose-1-phosphate uridylyltransferase
VVQALVFTLLDVFDASRDLYQTLKAKEKRDYEQNLRSRGYPKGRKFDYVEDNEADGDGSLVMDKAAVTRQFEIGFQDIGAMFAVGDGMFCHFSLGS